jgi:ATP-dependent Clp protease ATP-binding subunit ClpA
MYARLSPSARRVLVVAEGYSRDAGRAELDVVEMLAGILDEPDSTRNVLAAFGVRSDVVAASLGLQAPREASPPPAIEDLVVAAARARRGRGLPRWAPAAKAALERSLVYAVDGGREISPRDLLLGILDGDSSAAEEIWRSCGVNKAGLREALLATHDPEGD